MLIPATRYRDPEAALAFLTDVLGLTPLQVARDSDGRIVHVEMSLGDGVMMFGPAGTGGFDDLMTDPSSTGGRETTTIYVVVDDVSARHDRASAAGARIVMPLQDQDYGGSGFSVADPEGHIWSFGGYRPGTA